MERGMRRFKQKLNPDDVAEILTCGTNAILSLVDVDGEPYGVPISFVWDGSDFIYMHSAVTGRKIECIRHKGSCSLCVVAQDDVVPKEFTTYFRSVIAEGDIHIVDDVEERISALRMIALKYSPGFDSAGEIAECLGHVAVLRMKIISISGKEAIELARRR